MSAAMVVTPYPPRPGRACGELHALLQGLCAARARKAAGRLVPALHAGKGCTIHDSAPLQCRQFNCLWMTDGGMADEWRPDRARFVLSIHPPNGFVFGQVDPGAPGAWRRPPYYDGLRRMARALLEERRHVIMFVGDEATPRHAGRGLCRSAG